LENVRSEPVIYCIGYIYSTSPSRNLEGQAGE